MVDRPLLPSSISSPKLQPVHSHFASRCSTTIIITSSPSPTLDLLIAVMSTSPASSFSSASTALLSQLALGLSSLVIGYYLGVGRSLFSTRAKYNNNTASDDEDDEDSDEDADSVDLTDEQTEKMNALKAGLLEECKLVLLVRQDLKMDKGKIAAQCR